MLQLPEFCVDRNLGKTVPARLSALGWTMHLIAEEFPDDAQAVSDQDWIDYGLNKGWVPLCKDGRIRGRDHEREPVERHVGVLFYLDNQHSWLTKWSAASPGLRQRSSRLWPAVAQLSMRLARMQSARPGLEWTRP